MKESVVMVTRTVMVTVTVMVMVIVSAVSASYSTPIDVFQLGPYNVTQVSVLPQLSPGLQQYLEVWSPSQPGVYPVLYYLDGFAMATPASLYSEVLEHMASHGVIVVSPWVVPELLTPDQKLPLFVSTLDWARDNLERKLHNHGLPQDLQLDFNTLLAGAHSAGSHVLVSYLKANCGDFKGMVLMSPVDGADPMGIVDDFCITPGHLLNFNIPTLIIATGFDSVPGLMGLSCAPEDLSNERFWSALDPASQRWFINATDNAHMDVLNEGAHQLVVETNFCSSNPTITTTQLATYRRFLAGTTTAFFKAMLEVDCSTYLAYLEEPSVMLVNTTTKHVNPSGSCPVPGCSWQDPPATDATTLTRG